MNACKKYFYCNSNCYAKLTIALGLILLSSYFAKSVMSVRGQEMEPPKVNIPDNVQSDPPDMGKTDQQIMDPTKDITPETSTDEPSGTDDKDTSDSGSSDTQTSQEPLSSVGMHSGSTSSYWFIPILAGIVIVIIVCIVIIKQFRKAIKSRHMTSNNKNQSQSPL
jgi:hypothetical protein